MSESAYTTRRRFRAVGQVIVRQGDLAFLLEEGELQITGRPAKSSMRSVFQGAHGQAGQAETAVASHQTTPVSSGASRH